MIDKQTFDRFAVIEECAKLCDTLRRKDYSGESEDWVAGTADCAAAIRALARLDFSTAGTSHIQQARAAIRALDDGELQK